MKGDHNNNSAGVEQQRAQVGSLEGNVNLTAGNNYNQKVADVVAKQDLNITAKQIHVLDDKNFGQQHQDDHDLKVGVFAKVTSPILDLIDSVDKKHKSKADDRTKALQVLATGAQAYNTANSVQNGELFKAEAGIGYKTSKSQQDNTMAQAQGNRLNAGNSLNLNSTEGDIHLQNAQVNAQNNLTLNSARDILLESGKTIEKGDGKNSNSGVSVGVGASVGAQTGAYIYAEAGFGKGSNHLDSQTHDNTHLTANTIQLNSQQDTTLAGAQATAERIDANVGGKLNIISQQDHVEQNNKQMSAGGRVQISLGTAWEASGNVSSSNAKGSSDQVAQQSGLFAGKGGYHVNADHVELEGGAITSTAAKANNDLTANSLHFSHLENQSNYKATSISLAGGAGGQKETKTADGKAIPKQDQKWGDTTPNYSPGLPQYSSDHDSSTTYATLSDGNITIGGQATSAQALGIHQDIGTANAQVNTLPNLQAILDKQKTVADATSTISSAARTFSQNQQATAEAQRQLAEQNTLAKLQEEGGDKLQNYNNAKTPAEQQAVLKQYDEGYKTAANKAQDWGIGGNNSRAVNAVTAAITGALGGQTNLQVAANTLAPYAAQKIGENFGHGDNKNTAAQMASHAILGATLAYINGGDPTAGGTAAVASEAAANYLTQQYKDDKRYQNAEGEFMPNLLPESEKAKIRTLTSAIGAVAGGTVGSSAFNAQLSDVVGQNAVENNYLSEKQEQQKEKELKECDGVLCRGWVQTQWDSISAGQQASLTAGIVAGIPVSIKDSIVGTIDIVTSPIETYKQVKALINKENTLGYISDAMKNSFIQQLDNISESYEQAGAKGSFNAGVETGKLLTDIVSVVSGAGGVAKGAAKGGEIASKLITSPKNPIKLKAEFPENMTVEVAGISGGKKHIESSREAIYVDYSKSKEKGTVESKLVNDLKSNTDYQLSNGTSFKTNPHGHVEEIKFTPDFDNKGKRDNRQTAVGKLGEKTDVGGHIQACIMGGTCDRYNLFPQNSNFNVSAYKKYFENILRKEAKNGSELGEVHIKFSRNDSKSPRPDVLEWLCCTKI